MPLLALLLSSPLLAQDFVKNVAEPVGIERGSTWIRTFVRDGDSWWFVIVTGGEVHVTTIDRDQQWDEQGMVPLTGRDDLKDMAATRCDDGSFLVLASANLADPNDSAYAWTFDPDWNPIGSATINERDSSIAHNDMVALCEGEHRLAGFMGQGAAIFYQLDRTGSPVEEIRIDGMGFISGASALRDPETGGMHVLAGGDFEAGELVHYRVSADHQVTDTQRLQVVEPGDRAWWPQGLIRVGDYYVTTFVSRSESDGYGADTGNIFLAVLGPDWSVLETHQLTDWEPPDASMRPGVSRNGDQLLVSYDRAVKPQTQLIDLDLAAFGLDPDEETGWTGGSWNDSGAAADGRSRDDGAGCGCAASGAPRGVTLALLAGVFGLASRRRR